MNPDNAPWAVLFLVVVATFVVVGILVGMIVARSIDRFQAPRPPRPADDPEPMDPGADQVPDPQEEEPQP